MVYEAQAKLFYQYFSVRSGVNLFFVNQNIQFAMYALKLFILTIFLLSGTNSIVFQYNPINETTTTFVQKIESQNAFQWFIHVTITGGHRFSRVIYNKQSANNTIQYIFQPGQNFTLLKVSRNKLSCALFSDSHTAKYYLYNFTSSLVSSQFKQINAEMIMLLSISTVVDVSTTCNQIKIGNSVYRYSYPTTSWVADSYSLINFQTSEFNQDFSLLLTQNGLYSYNIIAANYSNVLSYSLYVKNILWQAGQKMVGLSYGQTMNSAPGYQFKLLIFQKTGSTWDLTNIKQDSSKTIPILKVCSQVNNFLLTYTSGLNLIQNFGIMIGLNFTLTAYEQLKTSSRFVSLTDNYIYIRELVGNSSGRIKSVVYRLSDNTKPVDLSLSQNDLSKYKRSLVQETATGSFQKLLNQYQTNNIIYLCEQKNFALCLDPNAVEDVQNNTVQTTSPLSSSSSSSIDTTTLIIIIVPCVVVVMVVILLIILYKYDILRCEEGCCQFKWTLVFQLGNDPEVTSQSLQSYMNKLQQQQRENQLKKKNQFFQNFLQLNSSSKIISNQSKEFRQQGLDIKKNETNKNRQTKKEKNATTAQFQTQSFKIIPVNQKNNKNSNNIMPATKRKINPLNLG